MSAVPLKEVVEELREIAKMPTYTLYRAICEFSNRIEREGIAPPDGRTPVAWAIDTPYGRAYSYTDELLGKWPVPDGWVLVPRNLTKEMKDVLTTMLTNCYSVEESYYDLITAAAPEVSNEP